MLKEIPFVMLFVMLFSLIPAAFAQEYPELGVRVETVAEGLSIPWSIDWLPDGTALFTERNGDLWVIQDGELQEEPLFSLEVGGVEGGLLGIAVDPNYSENDYIYLYYTYNEFITTANKLVRYELTDGTLTEDKVIMDGIPGGPFHDGGRIQFGPDEKLYITTGDAGNPDLSQDLDSLGGKILRINSDGTIPEDNPWRDSAIYTMGHRNPQGIDWDESGNLLATEHGPSGWRGSAHDEINVIVQGANYGWPYVIGDESMEEMEPPIFHTGNETWAPSGAEFYEADKIPQWSGKYFVATLYGNHLHMIDFDLENRLVDSHEELFEDEFGRLRDVQTGPDGYLYLLTSNQDGRGSPQINDDRILRILPMNVQIESFEDCMAEGNPIRESHPRQCLSRGGLYFVEDLGLCANVSKESPIHLKVETQDAKISPGVRVEGCVGEAAYSEGINIRVFDPDGEFVAGSTVVPESDGTFVMTFEQEFLVNGTYSVIADADNEFFATETFVVPEFAGIAMIVLVIGVVLTVIVSRTRLQI